MLKRTGYVLLLLWLLAACSLGGNEGDRTTAGPATVSPQPTTPPIQIPQGGTLTLRLAQDVGPLHPWAPTSHEEEQMLHMLYHGLTRLDATLAVHPDVATAWQSDATGRTLTMTLRTDLRWHDGEALTAADAAWTLNTLRAISPTTTLLDDLQQVLIDAHAPVSDTLVLKLKEPYAPLLAELSTPILPQHIFEGRSSAQLAATDFWQEPIGSGPFRFEERRPGAAVTFVRNDTYVDGVPYLDRVAFVVAPDPQVAAEALTSGELLGGELPWQTSRTLSSTQTISPALRFGAYPENGYYYLAFNLRQGRLFSDPRLREALELVLDRQSIAEAAGNGAMPISSDHLPGTWAMPVAAAPDRDVQRAQALLDEAGWTLQPGQTIRSSNGITLSAQLFVRGDDSRRVSAAERIAANAATVGINLEVTPADFQSVILSRIVPPFDFDIALMSWSNSRVRSDGPSYAAYDPDNFALFHSSQIYQGVADARPGLRNYVAFNDTSFDNLATAARALYDPERRRDLYRQTDELIAAARPYIFLWADPVAVVLRSEVRSTQGDINLDTPNWLTETQHWYLQP